MEYELINEWMGKDQPYSGLGLKRNTEIDDSIDRNKFQTQGA